MPYKMKHSNMTIEHHFKNETISNKPRTIIITILGLGLLIISQLLLSFGYEFLMSQKPIDFAHWSMLFASLMLFALWFCLPKSATKLIGLILMTIGIGGMIGMCCIDFILWAANDQPELKEQIFQVIAENDSIRIPFLILGPTLFYMGIGISTYGLFMKYKWQVSIINLGLLMIGLGHLIFHNRIIPVVGSVLLFVGLLSILMISIKKGNET